MLLKKMSKEEAEKLMEQLREDARQKGLRSKFKIGIVPFGTDEGKVVVVKEKHDGQNIYIPVDKKKGGDS